MTPLSTHPLLPHDNDPWSTQFSFILLPWQLDSSSPSLALDFQLCKCFFSRLRMNPLSTLFQLPLDNDPFKHPFSFLSFKMTRRKSLPLDNDPFKHTPFPPFKHLFCFVLLPWQVGITSPSLVLSLLRMAHEKKIAPSWRWPFKHTPSYPFKHLFSFSFFFSLLSP